MDGDWCSRVWWTFCTWSISRVCRRWHRLIVSDGVAWMARGGWKGYEDFCAFMSDAWKRWQYFVRVEPREGERTKGSMDRVAKEYKRFVMEPPPQCFVRVPSWRDVLVLMVTIKGPDGTPYEGGWFVFQVTFPLLYPFKPPRVLCKTKIYHPNIHAGTGEISCDILRDSWSPALDISRVMLSLCSLLDDPNPHDPLDSAVAAHYLKSREEYVETCRAWTRQYAVGDARCVAAYEQAEAARSAAMQRAIAHAQKQANL